MADIRAIHEGYVPPSGDMGDIAAMLRTVADSIEKGECGEVMHACVLMDNGKELMQMHRCTRPTTKLEWLGILQCAIHYVMR
jgi:hypothetical protein